MMKLKLMLTMVASLFVGTLVAQTEYAEKRINNPNHMLFSPFYFFDGTFMLSYERLFSSGALRITPSIKLQNLSDEHYSQREGWGIDLGYKFFLNNRPGKSNFYLGPYALYKNTKVKESYIYDDDFSFKRTRIDTYNVIGLGVDTGIKFIFGRFTMDISLGGGIRYAYMDGYTFNSTKSEWFDVDYKGIVPRGNFSFGIAF